MELANESKTVVRSKGSQKEQLLTPIETQPDLTVIIPTRNESNNIEPLLIRLQRALNGKDLEVIFVDDSEDDTPQVIQEVSRQFPFPITVIARPPERRNGLGMAVVEGMRIARAEWVTVMDGDLQHPPEVIAELLDQAHATGANLVAASRLAEGGSTAGLSWRRSLLSRVLAVSLRVIFPKNVGKLSDPLTGFFLLRRKRVDPERLRPEGFKILLEILVRNPELQVAEVPFEFGKRHSGSSKANGKEMLRLAQQTLKLRFVSAQRLLQFLTVGATGILVNSLLLFVFTDLFALHYLLSAILATQGSTLWNFGGMELWVFHDREHRPRNVWQRLAGFLAMNNGMLLLRGPFMVLLVSGLGMHYLAANLVSIVVMTVVRFAVSDRLIWGSEEARTSDGTYYYNIHNIIRIRSMQRLPELLFFRSEEAFDQPDIEVLIDRNVDAYRTPESIVYEEFLGRYGFSIVINRDEQQTQIVVSSLVGISPHVLYTNVVEPLLRWTFVRKGFALMHGACIAFDGQALFITAQTDTGKTTTILQTIRDNVETCRFLSDDMTIINQDGQVLCYPKPLTISHHTLRAVNTSPLTLKERLFLKVQSRLHSRSGRRIGMQLNDLGKVPAATLNAIVQAIIPPPKYMVTRLIPRVKLVSQARLSHIVVIERGPDWETTLDEQEKVAILARNAEDAYGFPPYPALAHLLSSWNGKDLHEAEQAIVQAAVAGRPGARLRSPRYDWHERLSRLTLQPSYGSEASISAIPSPAMQPVYLSVKASQDFSKL